jgi:TPR repeat protein
MQKGMLTTTSTARPSFLSHLIGLYRGDAAFRGVVDFAVIGAVVLAFMNFFPTKDGIRARQDTPQIAEKKPQIPAVSSTAQTPQRTTENTAQPERPGPVKALPKVAIQFPQSMTRPSLGPTRIFDVDQSTFRSSSAVDQPRLAAAARAARAQQFAEIANILAPADGADPNVAFMRGIGLLEAGTAEGNKSAEQAWRAASDAGHHQASLELARLALYGPPGVAKNVVDSKRVIEAAAASGNRHAQLMAAIAYLSGQFGLNPVTARDYLRRAAQAGDVEAMLYYAFTLGWAVGGPADQEGAEDYLRRAAVTGLTTAQGTLGYFLIEEYKQKVIDDPREGVEWLEKAAKSGYSLPALRTLTLFLGAETQPPWNDKAKVYELARLCSGIEDAWCQAENGWVYRFGIGTKRDLTIAFAHYQVANDLGYTPAAKLLEEIGQQITADERRVAIELSQKLRAGLKPVPMIWDLQYVGVAPPASRWSAADPVPTAREGALATCTRWTYRQIADLCNNCTAPPWNGEFKRAEGDEWIATFTDGHNKPGTSRWQMTSRSSAEILLYDKSRDLYGRIDLTVRKGFLRSGASGNWTNTSEILSTDCR